MPQSNAIFAFIFIGFLFFITARGELRKYMGYLLASPQGGGGTGSSANAATGISSAINSIFGGTPAGVRNVGEEGVDLGSSAKPLAGLSASDYGPGF